MGFCRSYKFRILTIFCVIIWPSFIGKAQIPLLFDHLGRDEGLSQNSVNCMMRDSRGFMWFGTQDGLNRYDGKKIRLYQNQPDNPATLSNNYILSMCEDEEGFLWIGTMAGGLNRFSSETGEFRIFRHNGTLNSLSENNVWAVIPDGHGNIWAGTSLGLNRYDKKSGNFRLFRSEKGNPASLPSDMVISLWMDADGMIWAGTTEGLCRLDPVTEKFVTCINSFSREKKDENIIWSVSGDESGKIYTATNNGVYSLELSTGLFTRLLGPSGSNQLIAWSVYTGNDHTLWAGTASGLYRINPGDGNYELFRHNPADAQSLPDDNVWCILADPAGNLWAGTKKGVSKTKAAASGFRLMNSDPGQEVRLSSSRVMAILKDRQGRLWIGTDDGGLNCISPGMQNNTVYHSGNSALRNNAVWALAEDREGNIWIGNYLGGLHVLRESTGIIEALPLGQGDPCALHNNRVLVLLPGEQGEIWTGTRGGGLVRYDPQTRLFKNYVHIPGEPTSIAGNTVLSLAFDRQKRLWVGLHEAGLNLFKPETGKFISFRKGTQSNLSDDNVWAVLVDRKGRLWLGTQGGLNYSEDPGPDMHLRFLGTKHGLNGNTVFGLLEDNLGNIWISSFNGLSRLNMGVFESITDPDHERNEFKGPLFLNVDNAHDLQGIEFNQGAYFKDHDGVLYFGGSGGLNFFSTSDIRENRFTPPVVLTGFRIFNKEVLITPSMTGPGTGSVNILHKAGNYYLPEEISHLSELKLSYRESVLSFDFAALDFSNPEKNQYAYKLSGFDKNWNFVGTRNTATYTNLNPGSYTFLVRGTNSEGIWNPEETRLKITIAPPFWKTWWFASFLAILAVSGIWIIFTDQKNKARKEKELIELQLKTIKNQIDPHFTFNALNTVASFIYAGNPDVTYDYFTRFASLIRNILKDNDHISRPLREEIGFVRNYLELQKIRFRDKFSYDICIGDDIPPEIQVPTMIIQSYAENAIKHGLMHRTRDGVLHIRIQRMDPCILISVEDNGIGRAKAAELNSGSTGLGLRMMDQIVALYRKLYRTKITRTIEDLTDEQGNAAGTKIMLTICPGEGQKRGYLSSLLRNKRIMI